MESEFVCQEEQLHPILQLKKTHNLALSLPDAREGEFITLLVGYIYI